VLIRLEQSGGFAAIPGLQKPVEVDTARLSAEETQTLEGLVRRTGLLDGTLRSVSAPAAGADLRDYTLTVHDHDAVRTVHLRDPLGDDAVAALISELQRHRGRAS
jgi:hypothetical protein